MSDQLFSLEHALEKAWSEDTTSDPKRWTRNNPAWGQCAVTALVVQDYIGGDIVWANVIMPDGEDVSHYFNKVCGSEYDLTRSQFPEEVEVPTGAPKTKEFDSTRGYVLSYEKTRRLYDTLREKVNEILTAPFTE